MNRENVIGFTDSSRGMVDDDGRWELKLPRGATLRGQALGIKAAREAVKLAHDAYALGRWAEGQPAARGMFVCKL